MLNLFRYVVNLQIKPWKVVKNFIRTVFIRYILFMLTFMFNIQAKVWDKKKYNQYLRKIFARSLYLFDKIL